MRHVITEKQARAITGGRTPLVPVEYEEAIKALGACLTLDEAKYWNDKADALAAWAKIYRSDEARRKAAQLKLHAYRRMGQLAEDLRPSGKTRFNDSGKILGPAPGSKSLLMEQGFNRDQAEYMRALSRLPETDFSKIATREDVPTPRRAARYLARDDPQFRLLASAYSNILSCIRASKASDVAAKITSNLEQSNRWKKTSIEISEWMDELHQHLTRPDQGNR